MKTVKDVDGVRLQLLPNRLLELKPSNARRWTATFKSIRRAQRENDYVLIEARASDNPDYEFFDFKVEAIYVGFNVAKGYIGCHAFSPKQFAKILKAAGVKSSRKKVK